jgi:6-pyruvoyltetrahydropterin/6-carboxytetrahydropterin synthase
MKGYTVTDSVTVRTSTAHRLQNHGGKCRQLHGHTYTWRVSLTGKVAPGQHMLMDYSEIKDAAKEVIGVLDHACVLETDDPVFVTLVGLDKALDGKLKLIGVPFAPSAEELARYAAAALADRLSTHEGVEQVTVACSEGPDTSAEYTAIIFRGQKPAAPRDGAAAAVTSGLIGAAIPSGHAGDRQA